MVTKQNAIYDFERFISSGDKKIKRHGRMEDSFKVLFKGSPAESELELNFIVRYVVLKMLRWDPKYAANNLTDEILEITCLKKAIRAAGMNPKKDLEKIIHNAFPNEIHFDFRQDTIKKFCRAAKLGPYKNDTGTYKSPKDFYSGKEGIDRANICISFLVDLYLSDMTIRERYAFFADTKMALKWLRKYHLDVAIRSLYLNVPDAPLEYYHYSLKTYERDDFLYNLYHFNIVYNMMFPEVESSSVQQEQEQKPKQMREEEKQAG